MCRRPEPDRLLSMPTTIELEPPARPAPSAPAEGPLAETTVAYPLRVDDDEIQRLDRQGRALRPATRFILRSAGIREGMRVLDLGSGAGDNAFVARELVGPTGEVLGLDRSAEAVARATDRARARGLSNVAFRVQDVHDPCAGHGTFDAVIGRLVLMYAPDPAAVLRRQARALTPGGIVAAIEFDALTSRSFPATPLVQRLIAIIAQAFERGGFNLSLGPELWRIMTAAGLRPGGMVAVQPHFGPGDPDGAGLLAGILRSSAPLIERTGVAGRERLGIDTCEDRLRAQLTEASAVVAYPMFYGTWGSRA